MIFANLPFHISRQVNIMSKTNNERKSITINISVKILIVIFVAAVLVGLYFGLNHLIKWYKMYYDPYTEDIFVGQSEHGYCTHDESFTEPIMPNGRYYPDGNVNAPYYLEITENKYYCFKAADGEPAALLEMAYNYNNAAEQLYGKDFLACADLNTICKKKEFKLITAHYMDGEPAYMWSEWVEFDHNSPFNKNSYRGEKFFGLECFGKLSFSADNEATVTIMANPDILNLLSPEKENSVGAIKLVCCKESI